MKIRYYQGPAADDEELAVYWPVGLLAADGAK